MSLRLINFRPVSLDVPRGEIVVDDDGTVTAGDIPGAEVIDCKGAYLSPGWCDLHVHVWHGGTDISVRASQAGRATGVTAMADAGSAGEAAFHGLREYVIEAQQETVRAFLNIGSIGLVACNRITELIDLRSIDVDRTLAVAEANRDVICGIKVRASGVISGAWGITPTKIAKRVAEILDLPLMVHVGEPPPMIDEVFDVLTPGDIVTHCFNGKKAGSILDTRRLFKQAKRVAAAGVRMDIGHGAASFSFATARTAIAEGLIPFSISTDLHLHNVQGPVYDLATTMSKLLAVGLSFDEVVAAVTERPRSVLGLGGRDGTSAGRKADFTVFELEDVNAEAVDSLGGRLTLEQLFAPRLTVIGASAMPAARRQR
jgi:dihydroorotase